MDFVGKKIRRRYSALIFLIYKKGKINFKLLEKEVL
jgi:hypothetical protein